MPSKAKAATLTGAQLRHLLRVTDATSRAPERDRLVLLFGVTDLRYARDRDCPCDRGRCVAAIRRRAD